MEYRALIRLRGFDVESDAAGRLLDDLNHRHGDLGPVLSGEGPNALDVIMATDGPNEAAAVAELVGAVGESLVAVGLGFHYPVAIEVEPVTGELVHA